MGGRKQQPQITCTANLLRNGDMICMFDMIIQDLRRTLGTKTSGCDKPNSGNPFWDPVANRTLTAQGHKLGSLISNSKMLDTSSGQSRILSSHVFSKGQVPTGSRPFPIQQDRMRPRCPGHNSQNKDTQGHEEQKKLGLGGCQTKRLGEII